MSSEKINTLAIKTPEGVIFALKLAGPVTRFLAWLIDMVSITLISILVNLFIIIVIAGAIGVIAEINPQALLKRHEQGWLDEYYDDLDQLIDRIEDAKNKKEAVSIGYLGNI